VGPEFETSLIDEVRHGRTAVLAPIDKFELMQLVRKRFEEYRLWGNTWGRSRKGPEGP
jgi:hypothetical protein